MTKKAGVPREKLAQAASLSARLGQAADELNDRITDVEQAFQALKLGVVASVDLYAHDDREDGYELVTFGKDGRNWRLLYQYGSELREEHTSVPLVNATREVRVVASERLPALLDHLFETAEAEVARVQERGQALADLASEIRSASARGKEGA